MPDNLCCVGSEGWRIETDADLDLRLIASEFIAADGRRLCVVMSPEEMRRVRIAVDAAIERAKAEGQHSVDVQELLCQVLGRDPFAGQLPVTDE